MAKRLTIRWHAKEHACSGIPTETLEAGGVVVPVEYMQAIEQGLKAAEQELTAPEKGRQVFDVALTITVVKKGLAALSRLQQNGEVASR